MANASLSPRQLATLLGGLDKVQLIMASMRDQLIRAMAERRRLGTPKRTVSQRTRPR